MMTLINTIDGVKQDLLQEGRRISRLKQQTAYCLIHGETFGRVVTNVDVAQALVRDGYRLYAKFNEYGDLVL